MSLSGFPLAIIAGAFVISAAPLVIAAAVTVPAVNGQFSKTSTAKVSGSLLALSAEFEAFRTRALRAGNSVAVFKSRDEGVDVSADGVVIDTAAAGDTEALVADLKRLGAVNVASFGRVVSARLPLTAITALNNLESLQLARSSKTLTHAGSVTSQGDIALRANIGRTTYSVTGAGIKVGTLSDSYNCLGTAAAGVVAGDLPAGVTVLAEGNCPASDEGRAMMEIIHDIAPGAALSFATGGPGSAGFATNIIALANGGAKVIVDDLSQGDEPMFQDGIVSQAIDTVRSNGVAYFTSSGNADRKAYEAPFRPSGQFVDIGIGPEEAHDFDPGPGVDICQQITIFAGGTVGLNLQWDQPYFSISGAPGSVSDMDILITNAACNTAAPLATSADNNIGGDPLESFSYTNPGPATTFGVVILHASGPNPGVIKYIDGREIVEVNEFDTKSGSTYGHQMTKGGVGVAAAGYMDTPAFGVTPPVAEGYSSAGGGKILFTVGGVRLATPETRLQPAFTSADKGNTSFFGTDEDGDGFPNFSGTSAAAPHAAGVAALMRQLKPGIPVESLFSALNTTTIDMDDVSTVGFDFGFDYKTGTGLIQADAALGRISDIIFASGFEN